MQTQQQSWPHHRKARQQKRSLLRGGMALLATATMSMLSLPASAGTSLLFPAAEKWLLQALAPTTPLVSSKEDLDWRLISRQTIKKDDCIRIIFENPYLDDAPETYKSFDMTTPYSQPCTFTSSHEATCSTIDAQTFQIQFTADNSAKKITGYSEGQPFQNPYSSRSFKNTEALLYAGCDLGKDPTVAGTTSIAAFQQAVIKETQVSLKSSSETVAVINAVLTMSFFPQTLLPQQGLISLQVPSWFTVSEQRLPVQYSSESMLGFESEATFASHAGDGFRVTDTAFDASSRSLTMVYTGTRIITNTEQIVFTIDNLRNPVNKDTKKGFRVTTQDKEGYLVDQSEAELALETKMTKVGKLVGKEVSLLGDANGVNIGRIFEYNQLSFFLNSQIPFEQFCYLKFVFPPKLKLDEALSIIEGDGIFAPTLYSTQLPTTYFRVDLDENTVYVEACTQPEFLSSAPFGAITFSYILLPDYVMDTDAVELYAYSDHAYQDLVFDESIANGGGMPITADMLIPGHLQLLEFSPSSYYASVGNVVYTVTIKPEHDMLPSTRVVLSMPPSLKMNSCTVTYTAADCALNSATNELTLSNVFSARTPGGTILKFIVSSGDNPKGARDAGKWGARTEGVLNGQYYVVDGNQEGESFVALAGYIKSALSMSSQKTFDDESELIFQFETEHDVDIDGTLKVKLPIEMRFPAEAVSAADDPATVLSRYVKSSVDVSLVEITSEHIILKFGTGYTTAKGKTFSLSLSNIRSPRSFRPSSEFLIQTVSPEGYVIDEGGTDIIVTMTEMNSLTSLEMVPASLVNGAVTDYHIKFDSFVHLEDGDRVLITTPPTIGFGPSGVSCKPIEAAAVGVTETSCELQDSKTLIITLDKLAQNEGRFELVVSGMKNPPNFRKSAPLEGVKMQTHDYFDIQQLADLSSLWVQTNEMATITDFTRQQIPEAYGSEASYTITFTPVNPISAGGVMTLEWTDQVLFKQPAVACGGETHKAFGQDKCAIDFDARTVTITDVFKDQYTATITVTLDTLRNPFTNRGLIPFVVKTFDDAGQVFAIDKLEYTPLTVCHWPCKGCGSDKDFCFSCWENEVGFTFLMTQETESTCKGQCDDGWTTNGDANQVCDRCDASCATCADNGSVGDKNICLTCAAGYGLRSGSLCVAECPIGTYESGTRCLPCDANCLTCQGSASQCTSCRQSGGLGFLLGSTCIDGCPPGMASQAGVCAACQYPCSQCSTGPEICTACDQSDGSMYLYGPTCIGQCPSGYNVNEAAKRCEGCSIGCARCKVGDNRVCQKCEDGLLLYQDECISQCPEGYFSDYDENECYSMADLDISLIPFPCLILAVVLFFLSYVGSKQKRKHLLMPNWLVLMGLLEHGCLLSQLILNFRFGTWLYGIVLILAYIAFVAANIVFAVLHYRRISTQDKQYAYWRNQRSNLWARRLMNVAGIVASWKSYKLSYSAFWGIKLTPAKFSNPKAYRDLQKRFLWVNIATYGVVILVNLVGLFDMNWGTQLYIQMIENIILFLVLIWAGVQEQKLQETDYLEDSKYLTLKGGQKLNVMSVLDEEDLPEFSKTKDSLLRKQDINKFFVERKFDELIKIFGDRNSRSTDDAFFEKTEDPRQVRTWPCLGSVEVITPIEPLPDPYPDNVYTQGLTEDQMRQMMFLSKNFPSKAIQSDAYDGDHNLRRDAYLVGHQRELTEVERSLDRKKVRGRKNRYFKQIDYEDHEAGILLDDDEEGQRENLRARNELLDARASLEVERLNENKKLFVQETRVKAMTLTEENLRLKKLLEDQRTRDARDQQEYQERIMEEERRRQEILANIEAARRQREDLKSKMESNLQSEKDARLKEIERMRQEHLRKNANLTDEQRRAAEAQFAAEKARLESEFNEKLLRSQMEPSDSANSPAKITHEQEIAVRLKPQGVKKSTHGSPDPDATHRMSLMNTADDISGFDNSYVQDDLDHRTFNEIDIMGNLERDDKGNVVVPTDSKTGSRTSVDRDGRPINHYGFLVDSETGDILHNRTGQKVFMRGDLDERGNIPMPHSIERFNFNPFDLLGTFFFDEVEDPLSFQKTQKKGRYIDELGRFVSLQGFLVDNDGSVINKDGVKRFDWRQFRQFGGLIPKLYNYYGKTFELQEIMGVFDRDSQGGIQLLLGKDERGRDVYVDKAGFMVNQKGYIVTRDGHICTREGKVLFLKAQLKNGEFPKIFPFTRFNINRVLGDIEMDPGGQPILQKNDRNQFVDKQGRLVNAKGFLQDRFGNVIDVRGKIVFEKPLLEHNGDIPEIFRSNMLRSDSQSSLSRFMSEIDRDQRFDDQFTKVGGQSLPRHAAASDTSFESMMEDSPSKYDKLNQRHSHSNPDVWHGTKGSQARSARWAGTIPDNIMEEMSEYEAGHEPHQKKPKRKKQGYIIEEVTGRDVQMANAYGGVAKPRIRKVGPRFASGARPDRSGLQTSQTNMRPGHPRIHNLVPHQQMKPFDHTGEVSMASLQRKQSSSKPGTAARAGATTRANESMKDTVNNTIDSNTGLPKTSGWREQHLGSSILDASNEGSEEPAGTNDGSVMRHKGSAAHKKRPKVNKKRTLNALQMPKYDRAFEHEFEKVYKKDIDKFIDGSDFEVESLAGLSDISKGTFKSAVQNNPRMKGLEKVYLQRLEFQQLNQKSKKNRPKPQVKREFLDRFCDDARYIVRGEQLKLEVAQNTHSSGKKKPLYSQLDIDQQWSQASLHGQDAGLVQTTGSAQGQRPVTSPAENFKINLQESGHSGQHLSPPRQPSRQNQR